MDTLIAQGLTISAYGIGLVFFGLGLLWASMALLTRIFPAQTAARPAAQVVVLPPEQATEGDGENALLSPRAERARVAAIAAGLYLAGALSEPAAEAAPVAPSAGAWLGTHRARALASWQPPRLTNLDTESYSQ